MFYFFMFFVQPPLSNSEKTYSMVIDQLQSLDMDVGIGSSPDPDPGMWDPFQMTEINGENDQITTYPPSPGMTSSKLDTPLKMNMEHNHGGLVQIIFLSKWVICGFQPLIFQGVASKSSTHLRLSMVWPVALMPCKPSPMPTPSRYPG